MEGTESDTESGIWAWVSGPRGALAVFVVFLVASVPAAIHLGGERWFLYDEWTFFTDRELDSVHDVLTSYNQHWVSVPLIAYRVLFHFFGIRSYLPYQLLVVGSHIAVVVLIRILMRRVGVTPWLATVTASLLVLFGPGRDNIVSAFQVTFTGALAFALAQLVLADHDGEHLVGWRDAAALGAGLLAIMSSGVAVPVLIATGVALLVRHGWKRAAIQVVPLGVIYVAWLATFGSDDPAEVDRPTLRVTASWVWNGVTGTFAGLGHYSLVAVSLFVMLAAGWVLVASRGRRAWVTYAAPAALVGAAVIFCALTAQGRWFLGSGAARSSRYLYVYVALALPTLGVAVQALVERWRMLAPVLVSVLGLALVANASSAAFSELAFNEGVYRQQREVLTSVVRLPEIREVPAGVRPMPTLTGPLSPTVGFLRGALDSGRLTPSTQPITPTARNEYRVRLGLAQWEAGDVPISPPCAPADPEPRRYPVGARFRFTKTVTAVLVDDAGRPIANPVSYLPSSGAILTVELPDLRLRLVPSAPGDLVRCGR